MAAHVYAIIGRPLYFAAGYFLLFFFAYSQRSEIGCSPYMMKAHDVGHSLSANLESMSEMCCTRLAENTGRKN